MSAVFPEMAAGGFNRLDSTIHFFSRVNALVTAESIVLDYGAGRGKAAEDVVPFRRELLSLRGRVRKVIGVDVDDAVLANTLLDEAIVFDGGRLPLSDNSVDIIISDWVFEHIPDPATAAAELYRVLKPGGWICARTPHAYSLIAIASRIVPNRRHAKLLRSVQPGSRQDRDVFPAFYRLNSKRSLRRHFPDMEYFGYTYDPAPAYTFGSLLVTRLFLLLHYLKRPICGELIMIFLRKPEVCVVPE